MSILVRAGPNTRWRSAGPLGASGVDSNVAVNPPSYDFTRRGDRPTLRAVQAAAVDVYVACFQARCGELRGPASELVDQPGLHGLLSSTAQPRTRLVVDADEAHAALVPIMAHAPEGATLTVFHTASRCRRLLDDDPVWRGRVATAMIARSLAGSVPRPVPAGLTIRAVQLGCTDPRSGVALEDAVDLAIRADPPAEPDATTSFVTYLRSLGSSLRLFAAVDDAGVVRGTSGVGVFGACAHVLFVNTDPAWRGRGVGTAMTAHALLNAHDRGADTAHLDASADGLHVYERLGFEAVGQLTQFTR